MAVFYLVPEALIIPRSSAHKSAPGMAEAQRPAPSVRRPAIPCRARGETTTIVIFAIHNFVLIPATLERNGQRGHATEETRNRR